MLVELSDRQNSWCSATVGLGNRHTLSFAFKAVSAETSSFVQLCKHSISQNVVASGEGLRVYLREQRRRTLEILLGKRLHCPYLTQTQVSTAGCILNETPPVTSL